MRGSTARARDVVAARLAAEVASYALNVPQAEIIEKGRGSSAAAFARQVAMYLCHVAFQWSISRTGIAFERDRSTVAHACHAIEDRRDDEYFDSWIASLEMMLREAPPPGPPAQEVRP